MLILKLALRNIQRNRRRSLLTVLSMGGGYFLLSLMLSMTEGSYSNMIDLFTRDHTGHVQIHKSNYLDRPSLFKRINNSAALIALIQEDPQVVSVTARIYGPSLAYGKNKTFPANVIGIDPQRESATTYLKKKVNQGVYLSNGMTVNGYFPAMMGKALAKNLHLNVGDELVLISQGVDGSIANDIFEVVAIVGTSESYERMNVYLSLNGMRQFLSMGGQVHELVISLHHHSLAQKFSENLQSTLQQDDLKVSSWQQVEKVFYKSMQLDKKGNYVSMGIIIFIVSIGVLNTVLMGTLERTREFGVLRAIGTQPVGIFKLIMLESLFLSLVSCFSGLLVSLPVNYWLTVEGIAMPQPVDMGGVLFESMRGEISWFTIGVPALVVIGSTLLVSLIPGIRAARISPLQALQAV